MASEIKTTTTINLNNFFLEKVPPSIFYIPNFINEAEEKELLEKVYSAPKPKWTHLSHRKLQNWGGLPQAKGMIAEPLPEWLQMYAEKLFELGVFKEKMPNHVLVNEYLPGQGIMPHEDGPLFFPVVATISLGSHTMLDFFHHMDHSPTDSCFEGVKCPTVNTEQKEDTDAMEKESKSYENRYFTSILLERRSLILVCDEMYKVHLHGIEERTSDRVTNKVANLASIKFLEGDTLERETRVSLTIRHVPKVLKSKLFFLGKR